MCLIFERKIGGGRIDWDLLERGYRRNPDGAGVLYREGDRWHAEKSLVWPWEDLRYMLTGLDRTADRWAVHFRWATVGGLDDRNCHPHSLGGGSWLMHNGTARVACPYKGRSDSWHLARGLRKGGRDILWLLRQATGSRLLIAHRDGELVRVGEWHERAAGWFSNDRCFLNRKITVGGRGRAMEVFGGS